MKFFILVVFALFLLSGCATYQDIARDPIALKKFVANGHTNELDSTYLHTMLHQATMDNNYKAVEYLIKHGADVNAVNGTYNETPLEIAVTFSSAPIVKLLIENGADQTVLKGTNPVHKAIDMSKLDIADYLIGLGFTTDYEKILQTEEAYLKTSSKSTAYEIRVYDERLKKIAYLKKLLDPSSKTYQSLKHSPSIRGYEDYLRSYPNGRFTAQARSELDTLRFNEVTTKNTQKAYEEFLRHYPQSSYVSNAKERLERMVKDKSESEYTAITPNDIKAYEKFIQKYPISRRSDEARAKIMEAVYARTQKEDTLEAYRSFEHNFPDSKYHNEIHDRLSLLKQEEVMDRITNYMQKKDINGLISYVKGDKEVEDTALKIPRIALLFSGPDELMVIKVLHYAKQGLGDALLTSKIRAIKKPYKDFSLDEVALLKKQGLSEGVLAAMIDATTDYEERLQRQREQEEMLAKQEALAQKMQKQQDVALAQMREEQKLRVQQQSLQNSGASNGLSDRLVNKATDKIMDSLLDKLF